MNLFRRHPVRVSLILFGWLLTLGLSIRAAFYFRAQTIDQEGTAAAQSEWQQWKAAVPEQNAAGPVVRKVPVVTEPPGLILARDHFPAEVGFFCLGGTVAYGLLLLTVVVIRSLGADPRSDQQS